MKETWKERFDETFTEVWVGSGIDYKKEDDDFYILWDIEYFNRSSPGYAFIDQRGVFEKMEPVFQLKILIFFGMQCNKCLITIIQQHAVL